MFHWYENAPKTHCFINRIRQLSKKNSEHTGKAFYNETKLTYFMTFVIK